MVESPETVICLVDRLDCLYGITPGKVQYQQSQSFQKQNFEIVDVFPGFHWTRGWTLSTLLTSTE